MKLLGERFKAFYQVFAAYTSSRLGDSPPVMALASWSCLFEPLQAQIKALYRWVVCRWVVSHKATIPLPKRIRNSNNPPVNGCY